MNLLTLVNVLSAQAEFERRNESEHSATFRRLSKGQKRQGTQSPTKRSKMEEDNGVPFDSRHQPDRQPERASQPMTSFDWHSQDLDLYSLESFTNNNDNLSAHNSYTFRQDNSHFIDAFQHNNHSIYLPNDGTTNNIDMLSLPENTTQSSSIGQIQSQHQETTTYNGTDDGVLCPDADCCDKSDCESVGCPTPCAGDDSCSVECDDCEVTPCLDCTELAPCYSAKCLENFAYSEASFAVGRTNSSTSDFTHQSHSRTDSISEVRKRKYSDWFEQNPPITPGPMSNYQGNQASLQDANNFMPIIDHGSCSPFVPQLDLGLQHDSNLRFFGQEYFETPQPKTFNNSSGDIVDVRELSTAINWQDRQQFPNPVATNDNGARIPQPYFSHHPILTPDSESKSTFESISNVTSLSASPCTPMSLASSNQQSLSNLPYCRGNSLIDLDQTTDYAALFKDSQIYCPFFPCQNDFNLVSELDQHLATVHPAEVTYHCHVSEGCPYATDDVYTFARHVLAEKARNIPEAESIPLIQATEENVDEIEEMDPKAIARAYICNWTEHDTNDIDTPICGHVFNDPPSLQQHIKLVHIEKLSKKSGFFCHWKGCFRRDQSFSQKGKVERHVQTHTNYKHCICDICGKPFSAKQSLIQHMRLHNGEKPYKCNFCDKTFAQSSALTLHKRVHTGEKPLLCDFPGCGKRFSESSNLSKHKKTHNESGAHKCSFDGCKKSFHRADLLKRHYMSHERIMASTV